MSQEIESLIARLSELEEKAKVAEGERWRWRDGRTVEDSKYDAALRNAWPQIRKALASLSERQEGQIGHSASGTDVAGADRGDALPEEPRHNDDCLARALGGACSCDLERRLRAYAARQREDALEEAARICDKQEEYIRKREHTYYDTRIAQGAFECAAAIRAAAKEGK